MTSLEKIRLWNCAGITNAGVAALAALPNVREGGLEGLPNVTRQAATICPPSVRVDYWA